MTTSLVWIVYEANCVCPHPFDGGVDREGDGVVEETVSGPNHLEQYQHQY